jgi:hypothetical protein
VPRRRVDGRRFGGPLEQRFGLGPIAHFHRRDTLLRQISTGGDVLGDRTAAEGRTTGRSAADRRDDEQGGNLTQGFAPKLFPWEASPTPMTCSCRKIAVFAIRYRGQRPLPQSLGAKRQTQDTPRAGTRRGASASGRSTRAEGLQQDKWPSFWAADGSKRAAERQPPLAFGGKKCGGNPLVVGFGNRPIIPVCFRPIMLACLRQGLLAVCNDYL